IQKNRMYNYEDFAALMEAIFSGHMGGDDDDEKPVGEYGRLRMFVSKADAKGWNVASLKYAWEAHKMFPDDADITLWCAGLFRELAVKNELRLDDFATHDSLFYQVGDKAAGDSVVAKKIKSNTPQGRFQAAIDHLDRDSLKNFHYWQFAFIEEMKDSAFVKMFRVSVAYADSIELEDSLWYDKSKREKRMVAKEYKQNIYGPQGIDRLVAVNPVYVVYDYRNETSEVDVRKTLAGRDELVSEMEESASTTGIALQLLDAKGMNTTNVDQFNDLMVVSEWFDQRSDYNDNQILPYPQGEMKALAEKYGTKYFMWSAYITSTEKRGGLFFRALSLAFAPLAPQIAYKLLTPRQNVYYIVIVYDITTGKPVFIQRTEMNDQQPTKDRMRLHVFDLMRTLSKPKKSN
ncbi:MAG TPA: hypothetical protein VI731_01725, partial [Bacteroidia bacterium]|nr:hypothetical protein [Bacteroidia bacterium]